MLCWISFISYEILKSFQHFDDFSSPFPLFSNILSFLYFEFFRIMAIRDWWLRIKHIYTSSKYPLKKIKWSTRFRLPKTPSCHLMLIWKHYVIINLRFLTSLYILKKITRKMRFYLSALTNMSGKVSLSNAKINSQNWWTTQLNREEGVKSLLISGFP